jgi:hypothetical protein
MSNLVYTFHHSAHSRVINDFVSALTAYRHEFIPKVVPNGRTTTIEIISRTQTSLSNLAFFIKLLTDR